ncbi:protein ripply2 [Ailuropoda melanoleuca]|uniref:Ripply transcriptional repressor 2 n=1 Tax=Ailuropoda melanoleuca TaxID=9646 RepID=G1LKN8_AILME|nr:protein ripply2 [Ailuropoda melanoleuca]
MDTGEPSARGAGECARCHRSRRRPPPAGPDRPTRRQGADSGGSTAPALALPPACPQLLPIALRPPPAAGPRSAAGGPPGSGLSSPPRALCPPARRSAGFWRPWVDAPGYEEEGAPQHAAEAMPDGPGVTAASGKPSPYRHPVRLFWPKSKCYDYLYQEAEALLKNFPIQATISFYEDSDSEDDIEELICEN